MNFVSGGQEGSAGAAAHSAVKSVRALKDEVDFLMKAVTKDTEQKQNLYSKMLQRQGSDHNSGRPK